MCVEQNDKGLILLTLVMYSAALLIVSTAIISAVLDTLHEESQARYVRKNENTHLQNFITHQSWWNKDGHRIYFDDMTDLHMAMLPFRLSSNMETKGCAETVISAGLPIANKTCVSLERAADVYFPGHLSLDMLVLNFSNFTDGTYVFVGRCLIEKMQVHRFSGYLICLDSVHIDSLSVVNSDLKIISLAGSVKIKSGRGEFQVFGRNGTAIYSDKLQPLKLVEPYEFAFPVRLTSLVE